MVRHIILATLTAFSIAAMSSGRASTASEAIVVPRAICGPRDRVESVQGQTTLAERFGESTARPYACNLELIGQYEGEGTSFDMEVLGDCAYYSTAPNPQLRHPGVVVLDVSDRRRPQVVRYLQSPAMLDAVESLEVDPVRKLLIASKPPDGGAAPFDIYDLSGDCRNPVLKSSQPIPKMMSHGGQFGPDGRTFYAASIYTFLMLSKNPLTESAPPPSGVFAIDVSDPSKPVGIATWIPPHEEWRTHSISVNADGTRAYIAITRDPWDYKIKLPRPNGIAVLDISDINARSPKAQFRLISTLFWNDTFVAQFAKPIKVGNRQYLVFTDLMGSIGIESPVGRNACNADVPSHGMARLIDVSDEQHPKVTSTLMLEVHDPQNCEKVRHDPVVFGAYGASVCDVDSVSDARLLACGYYESGLRVFDIRNPSRPTEVAYYKPAARRKQHRPGSPIPTFKVALQFPQFQDDHTADAVIVPRFRNGGQELWFNSLDGGFQVVRFTGHFRSSYPDLL